MKTINLRDYYSQFSSDYLLEVADEIASCFVEFKRREHAYEVRRQRYRAYYSLDRNDGIEKAAICVALTPHEVYEKKLNCQELYAAFANLPEKQAKRVYAHFFLNMSVSDIARVESVRHSSICDSINRGIRNIALFLKNSQ